ncbi:MAG: hypothetical protein ACK2T7_12985 [Anaerolineales bacterium]
MSAKKTEERGSFWTTLPGIITAITGLIVAIGGLITILGDEGILKSLGISRLGTETPTGPVSTPVDQDDPDLTPGAVTPTWEENAPCYKFLSYDEQIEGYEGVILAWSQEEVWVRVSELEMDVLSREDVTAKRFPYKYGVPECLAQWIKYLSEDRVVHWPVAESSQGRAYSEVWFASEPTLNYQRLESFPVKPDMLLLYVLDGDDRYMQIYHCVADIPPEVMAEVASWFAATDEAALLELYETRFANRELRPTVPCQ